MLKFFLNTIIIVISFYWAGDIARQNNKINYLVLNLENGYQGFNSRLKDAKIRDGLVVLKSFYGWASIVVGFLSFFLHYWISSNFILIKADYFIFLILFLGWFSLRWCLDHRAAAIEFAKPAFFVIASPLLLAALEYFSGTPLMHGIFEPFTRISFPGKYGLPHFNNPFSIGMLFSIGFLLLFGFYYFITWLIAMPVAFSSALLVSFAVLTAKFIHTLAPRKAFAGFTFLVFAICVYTLMLL